MPSTLQQRGWRENPEYVSIIAHRGVGVNVPSQNPLFFVRSGGISRHVKPNVFEAAGMADYLWFPNASEAHEAYHTAIKDFVITPSASFGYEANGHSLRCLAI